ncbi:MAG TPA: M48 family metalloprotease [Methylophilus sp.]|nr:M48 family metalloprotease [Methylophilus sp.]HQQ33500.1 M48 family metalloprotease [Methylophilus sp.]
MRKPVLLALISAGLLGSASVYALNLGDVLKDAAKEQIEKELGTEKPAETPPASQPATSTSETVQSQPTSAAPAASSNAPATVQAEKPAFNWKKPSKEEEIALGREITGSLLGAAPLVKDDALQKYVNRIGRWVASQSERADLPWKFGVIESADINAFAAPGGYVLITKGLYQNLQNEAQLAGVLGHEIAHVVKKHQLKVLQKQQLLNSGTDWIKEKFAKKNKIAEKTIGTGAEISARSLDKEAEFEADRMGMILAARAGYDVYGLSEVLQTMGQVKPGDNSVALLFKTHPHPDERLAKLGDSAGNQLDNIKPGKTLENRFYKTH